LPVRKVVDTVEFMDHQQAQRSLAQAQDAYAASSRPVLPLGAAVASALAAGCGVALVGLSPERGWLHAVLLVGGIVLMGAALGTPALFRRRSGLHGFRGRVRSDNIVFLLCAVTLVINGLDANRTLSAIYLGLGAVVGIAYFLLLRGRAGRRS
jgi:hypothetical protein